MTQVIGVIKVIMETEQVSEKFAKRNFVVTTDTDMYPQDIQMQCSQDKCAMLDNYKEGDQVVVDINIRGREWINPEGKSIYFVTLDAWKMNKDQESSPAPTGNIESNFQEDAINEELTQQEEDDDLPF